MPNCLKNLTISLLAGFCMLEIEGKNNLNIPFHAIVMGPFTLPKQGDMPNCLKNLTISCLFYDETIQVFQDISNHIQCIEVPKTKAFNGKTKGFILGIPKTKDFSENRKLSFQKKLNAAKTKNENKTRKTKGKSASETKM